MPFQYATFAKVHKMFQWNGTTQNLSDLQTYVSSLAAARPWADEKQTQPVDAITAIKNADNSLTLTLGTDVYNVSVGDWIGEIVSKPNGRWGSSIIPNSSHQNIFSRISSIVP